MTDYFVRIHYNTTDKFYDFCSEHNLKQEQMTNWPPSEVNTALYKITMRPCDVTALKLSLPIFIMEAPK